MSIKAGQHFRANERWGTNNIKTQNVALTSALLTETAFTLQSAVDAQRGAGTPTDAAMVIRIALVN
jgi:hypothetical protein